MISQTQAITTELRVSSGSAPGGPLMLSGGTLIGINMRLIPIEYIARKESTKGGKLRVFERFGEIGSFSKKENRWRE